jgi:ABC-type amino acid transport substrate-binding protein
VKRFSIGIMALLMIGFPLVACGGESTLAEIQFGTDATFLPFETIDMTSKEYSGFDIELMRSIAGKAGLKVNFSNVGFFTLIKSIGACQYDGGISAIAIQDQLKQLVNFSDPYLTVGQVVVVKKGNLIITGRDQLQGMAVGSQRGSASILEIQKIPGTKLVVYDSFDLAFQDLVVGNIDAVIAGSPRAQSYVSIKANNLKIAGTPFASESYAIAVCNKNAALLKQINTSLAALKADGTLDRLAQKWLKTGY